MLPVGGDEHLVSDGHLPRQCGGEREGLRAARRYVDGHHADGPLQPVEALALQPDSGLPRLVGVVVEDEGEAVVARLDGHQPVGVGVPQRVPERFADPVAVDRRPGRDRPAVVELPDDHPLVRGCHERRCSMPNADRAGLVHGHGPVPVVDVGRLLEVGREAAAQLEVAVLGLLVAPHPGRGRGQRDVMDRGGQRRPGRRALAAELGHEPRGRAPVGRVVDAVPDVPEVAGPVVRVVRAPPLVERPRAARRVRPGRVQPRHQRGQQLEVVAAAPGEVAELRRQAQSS